jgi:alkylhydroperoxidase family enzyme
MFLTVIKAVRTPHEVNESDVSELRALGWTDQDILEGVGHGAFSVAFDMILNTFKVSAENLKPR